MDLPREAIGFHGTSKSAVPHLLARNIRPSDQHFEWLGLGTGFYLCRTLRGEHGSGLRTDFEAAVVVARVDLAGCLDLLNPRWQTELHDANFELVSCSFSCGG